MMIANVVTASVPTMNTARARMVLVDRKGRRKEKLRERELVDVERLRPLVRKVAQEGRHRQDHRRSGQPQDA
jgi:hypothetical protein